MKQRKESKWKWIKKKKNAHQTNKILKQVEKQENEKKWKSGIRKMENSMVIALVSDVL